MRTAYLCYEAFFEHQRLFGVVTDETLAQQWVARPAINKDFSRFYEPVPLEPSLEELEALPADAGIT